jgi:hypothetical protein
LYNHNEFVVIGGHAQTGINPVLQATFTFAQMYFIFTYSRLMINKFKLIARLGLMHLVGTNICIWIRTLGKETLQVSLPVSPRSTSFDSGRPFSSAGTESVHFTFVPGRADSAAAHSEQTKVRPVVESL